MLQNYKALAFRSLWGFAFTPDFTASLPFDPYSRPLTCFVLFPRHSACRHLIKRRSFQLLIFPKGVSDRP